MDKFIILLGSIGGLFLLIAFLMLISALNNVFKMKINTRRIGVNVIIFIVISLIGFSSLYLMLFLKTFSLYTRENKIGLVYAKKNGDSIKVYYRNFMNNKDYNFNLKGEEWMIEGYILRWKLPLRFLGTKSYYKVAKFSGRNPSDNKKTTTSHLISSEGRGWRFLLKNCKSIPFVDAVYGIGAFQYPAEDTFFIYINDTGFIIKKCEN